MSVCKVRLVSVKEQQKKSVELLSFVFGRVGQIRLLVTARKQAHVFLPYYSGEAPAEPIQI